MRKGYIYILLAAVIFSTMEISGKMVAAQINPFELTLVRFLIGGLILLPFALRDIKERKIKLGREDISYFILTGFLCVLISMSFFQLAVVYTKASVVAIVFSTNPVFTIPIAWFILKEKFTKITAASLTMSILGIICILNPFNLSLDFKGIIMAALAALTFSIYSVVGKKRMARYGSRVMNSFTFLIGDIMLIILILASHIKAVSDFFLLHNLGLFSNIPLIYGINNSNILTVIYLGVVVTGLGYLFYFMAMDETSVSTASVVFL
jgi:drug/metabolite transporter (DMT)-like permease